MNVIRYSSLIIAWIAVLMFWTILGQAEMLVDEYAQVGDTYVFKDHNSSSGMCYYMPTPRVGRRPDGSPDLTFLEYIKTGGGEEFTGGSLQFTVELGLTDTELRQLKQRLPSAGLKCRKIGPVVFKSGEFMVVSAEVGEGGVFTRGIVGEGRAPLLSRTKAAISIALRPEGATFIKKALSQSNYSVYARFDMMYSGLTNKYDVTATIDWSKVRQFLEREHRSRIYRRLERKFGPLRWVWYIKVGERQESYLSDHLRASGSIIIEKIGDDESMEPVLQMLTDRIMQAMTEVTLDLPQFTSEAGEEPDTAGTMPYGTRIQKKNVSQSGKFKITLKGRERVERSTGPMDTDVGITLRRAKSDERTHRIFDLDDPDFQTREVTVSLDIEGAESFGNYINYATVSMRKRYQESGRPVKTAELSFNRKTFEESANSLTWTYPLLGEDASKGGMQYDYRVEWSFAGGAKIESSWETADSPTIPISPPLKPREINIVIDSGNAEENGVRFIQVQIKNRVAGKVRLREVQVNPGENSWVTYNYYHPENDLSYEYRITWFLREGSKKVTSEWRKSTDAFIDLNYQG